MDSRMKKKFHSHTQMMSVEKSIAVNQRLQALERESVAMHKGDRQPSK